MQLYFLNIRDGSDLTSDPEGSSLPSIDAARQLAIECARQMMGEAVSHGSRIGLDRTFEINDEAGTLLLAVPFRDAINFSGTAEFATVASTYSTTSQTPAPTNRSRNSRSTGSR